LPRAAGRSPSTNTSRSRDASGRCLPRT